MFIYQHHCNDKGTGSNSWQGKEIFIFQNVQTSSEAHLAFNSMGPWDSLLALKLSG